MDATTETTPSIHLTSEYGAAARKLDALWHEAAMLENYAESLNWQNEEQNARAAAAWNAYAEARHLVKVRARLARMRVEEMRREHAARRYQSAALANLDPRVNTRRGKSKMWK
jgi:hypothetical protein